LPRSDFQRLIEARRFDLYDDPMPDLPALISYCDATSSCLFRGAGKILSGQAAEDAAHFAGIAYALTRLLRALPLHAARGQCFVPADLLAKHGASPAEIIARQDSPALRAALAELRAMARDHLAQAQASVGSLAATTHPAFLPFAILPLYLTAMEHRDYDPFTVTEVPQWRRQWRLWRKSRPTRGA
jgi:phytoene synthase